MDTGVGTGVKIKTENVSITVEPGSSSSHSTRDNQKESATPERSNHKIRWLVKFIEIVVCVLFLGGLIVSFIIHKNYEIWGLELWKWCVLVLVIVGGRRVMKLTMEFVVFVVKWIFFSMECKVCYSYYIYSLGKYVGVFLWFGLVLLTCYFSFKSSQVKRSKLDSNVQKYIMKSLATCVIGGFLWVLKTLLVNILTPPFQATRLFDRFRESLIDQYILEVFSSKLSDDELTTVININWIEQNNLPKQDCFTDGSKKVINWLKKIEPEEISAWTMKKLIKVIRSAQLSPITKKLEMLAKKERDLTKLFLDSEEIAKKIFTSTDGEKIEEIDLRGLFNEEACDVVEHIEGGEKVTGAGGIEIGGQALKKWLVNAVVERRSLAQSLEDSEGAKKDLNEIVCGVVLILVFIIWLIMLGVLTTGALVVLITQFAALAFIFGDTGKSVFQGIIFVSVTHPFDVGDSCLIDGEEMMVERVNLLSTVFRKNMKGKIVYPNSVLISMHIKNLDKDNRHVIEDSFEITIDSSTPQHQIENLRSKIQGFLQGENQKEKLRRDFHWKLKEIENKNLKIVLTVYYLTTKDLSSDWEIMRDRRHLIVEQLKMFLQNEEKGKNNADGQDDQEKKENKGENTDDRQEKEGRKRKNTNDGQTKEEKENNKDDGQKIEKMNIRYYDILPKAIDA